MEPSTMLTLSTAHLKKETVEAFDAGHVPEGLVIYPKGDYGYFVYVTDDALKHYHDYSDELKALTHAAFNYNASVLCFDRDGIVSPCYPKYDW